MTAKRRSAPGWSGHGTLVSVAFAVVLGYGTVLLWFVFPPSHLGPQYFDGQQTGSVGAAASAAPPPASQVSAATQTCDHGKWGQLGDSFGGVTNSLISLAVLFYAMNAFRTQKEELRFTGELLAKQFRSAEQQERRRTFFDLVGMHAHTLADLQSMGPSGRRGRDAIAEHFTISLSLPNGLPADEWLVNQFKQHADWLGSYLRSASVILSFMGVSLSDWNTKTGQDAAKSPTHTEDQTLTAMFSAQFTQAELNLFAAVALSGDPRFSTLLLEPLHASKLLDKLENATVQQALGGIGLGKLAREGV